MRNQEHAFPGFVLVAALIGCAAPAPSSTVPASVTSSKTEPCRGIAFDADNPDPRCLVPHHEIKNVPADALRLRLTQSATIRSGQQAQFVLEMQNASGRPLPLEIDDSCGAFEAEASNEKATTFESECGGLCGGGPDAKILRVTLEPGGAIRKKVSLTATMRRVVAKGDECTERVTGALPPGTYTLQIPLPWSEPMRDNPGSMAARIFSAPLVVTP